MIKKITTLILTATCFSLFADINTVIVPADMLHSPNIGLGLGFQGKVQYTLTPLANDSIFVTLSIVPVGGGDALKLSDISGDVGVIKVNTNQPNSAKIYEIFFQAVKPVSEQKYKAKITATPFESNSKKKIESLLKTISKSDKVKMMSGNTKFSSAGAGSVPDVTMADGPHGIRNPSEVGGGNGTSFPTCVGLASTWDTAMAYQQGKAIGKEYRAYGRMCHLGPALNIIYHPQGGRSSEYGSEDPYLSGRMAAADVKGVQSESTIATVKHFACNSVERNRWSMSADMDERSLREIYLYNWAPAFLDAECWSVMTSYNKVNRVWPSSDKYTLDGVLRNEWGYKYLSMTDWGGAVVTNDAVKYGVDIKMPDAGNEYKPDVLSKQPDSLIDQHIRRILWTHAKVGSLEPGYQKKKYNQDELLVQHRKVAREVGSNGIVLAKNTNNLLPLPKKGKKIAITGPFANKYRSGPAGSSGVPAKYSKNPLDGIKELLKTVGNDANTIVTDIKQADYVIVFVGVNYESEGSVTYKLDGKDMKCEDRPFPKVTDGDDGGDNYVKAALEAKPNNTIVVFTGGSAVIEGHWSKAPAILLALYPGQEQGYCIADILFGEVNPSGKLPITFPKDESELPNFKLTNSNAFLNYPRSDTAHGYFRVNKMKKEPLFNFGHGLSYTSFDYSNLQIFPNNITAGDRVNVSVKVTNTGNLKGKEVVQLYLSMPQNSQFPVRVQDLRGFAKVELNPGESKDVKFTLTAEEMQIWNPNGADYSGKGKWQVLSGKYDVRVGTSSQQDLKPTLSTNFSVK